MDPLLAISWGELWSFSSPTVGNMVVWTLVVVGFAGTILPFLPGTFFILLGAVIHRFWFPLESSIGWPGFVILSILFLLSLLADWASGAIGAKWFGASKWGMAGAIVGGIFGFFIGNIIGLIVGPLVGAFAFEMIFARQQWRQASSSTWGTLLGTATGLVAQAAIGFAMIVWMVVDVFFW